MNFDTNTSLNQIYSTEKSISLEDTNKKLKSPKKTLKVLKADKESLKKELKVLKADKKPTKKSSSPKKPTQKSSPSKITNDKLKNPSNDVISFEAAVQKLLTDKYDKLFLEDVKEVFNYCNRIICGEYLCSIEQLKIEKTEKKLFECYHSDNLK